MTMKEISTAEGYNIWSEFYEKEDNPMVAYDELILGRELDIPISGKKLIDLGCGTGRYSIKLARAGAIVSAVDISEGMINKARQKSGADLVSFYIHDLEAMLPFDAKQFDIVLSSLVLEHIGNLELFFNEAARLCKQDGLILMSAMHPAMMLKGVQANFDDPVSGVEIRPKGYPNQISDFINAISKANLKILNMNEYFGCEKLEKISPKAGKFRDWPMLLVFKLAIN